MSLPEHFAEARIDVPHELMRAHPLATRSPGGLDAKHIPLQRVAGTLPGHVARAGETGRPA